MPSPFPWSPVIRECSRKKTPIEKKKYNDSKNKPSLYPLAWKQLLKGVLCLQLSLNYKTLLNISGKSLKSTNEGVHL